MKLHPLILTTQDVQALIEGRKTRHSMPVKPQPALKEKVENIEWHEWKGCHYPDFAKQILIHSPFGSPGDQEWQTGMPPEDGMYWVEGFGIPVRLTPLISGHISIERFPGELEDAAVYGVTPEKVRWKRMGSILYLREAWAFWNERFHYKADQDRIEEIWRCPLRFNSPATMPREASRIYLEVTGVTCKRVQDITEEEAKAEGCYTKRIVYGPHPLKPKSKPNFFRHEIDCTYRDSYEANWKQRHGPDSWDNNSWVFSCNWKVLSINGKPSYL